MNLGSDVMTRDPEFHHNFIPVHVEGASLRCSLRRRRGIQKKRDSSSKSQD